MSLLIPSGHLASVLNSRLPYQKRSFKTVKPQLVLVSFRNNENSKGKT